MRSVFPAHFRPTSHELTNLWKDSIFAIDANVLLNLYRYSSETRMALEATLTGIKKQLFIPHQAAREFLKNRLSVTAAQADEYQKTIREINELSKKLQNKKRHPFLPEENLPQFQDHVKTVVDLLVRQHLLY